MKHSMTPRQGTPPRIQVTASEIHSAPDHNSMSDTFPNVTLGDIYKKLVELLFEVAKQKVRRKAIRLPDVKEMTGESRSQIYARMNPKYSAHDETWPLPFYVGRSPRWWLHEVEAWLEAQAVSTTFHHQSSGASHAN